MLTMLAVLALSGCHGSISGAARPDAPSATRAEQRLSVLSEVNRAYFERSQFPGAVMAAHFHDGATVSSAVGLSDRETRRPMDVNDRLLAGSSGKTFFAALALQLVDEGLLDLDQPIGTYLEHEPWISRLAGSDQVTVRILMNHTSGYGEYDEAFMNDLIQHPLRQRAPIDMISSILDRPIDGTPGVRMRYSDLNYILLAEITEQVTHNTAYAEIDRRFIKPLGLAHTSPSTSPQLEGLVPGYAGKNPFGPDKFLVNGALALNPQFEWGGGGFVSTAGDLATWLAAICEGSVIPKRLWPEMTHGVDAPDNGQGAKYGLGLHIDPTPLGIAYGHGGFFPGYSTFVRYFPELQVSVALMINSSAEGAMNGRMELVLIDAASALRAAGLN
jgi:D-alanyl-D-alanine carboxypeptidase